MFFRTIVLNVTTLAVLVYFWFTSVDCSQRDEDDNKWLDSELECRPVSTLNITFVIRDAKGDGLKGRGRSWGWDL